MFLFFFWFLCVIFFPASSFCLSENFSLINKEYVANFLTKDACWADSHCASSDFLGSGMLYYSLAYMKKAKLCVCLGSGGGFVPRVMKQAQRDLGLDSSCTVLVDGDMGNYGRPQWLNEDSFFRNEFPDIEIVVDTTHNIAVQRAENWKIDYLHIDADHSLEGALQDFIDYLPLMAVDGIITFHDTNGTLPCAKVIEVVQEEGFDVINFAYICAGVAIISPKKRIS